MVKKTKKDKKSKHKHIKKYPSFDLRDDREIAMDFAARVYEKFDKLIKAIVLFGSSVKNTSTSSSDIDIVIIADDAVVKWDQELIAWYREELSKIAASNKYRKEIHITTTRITSWWSDLLKGDPTVMNILRYGETLIDVGGFFDPLKTLLIEGRIRSTPEAIYNALERAPMHFQRSKLAELGGIEGLFWAMVDSSQAALMASNINPPSPEQISLNLKETFVDKGLLKIKYVVWYRDLYVLHKKISHGEIMNIKGQEIDDWQEKTLEFIQVMVKLVNDQIDRNKSN